MKSFKVLVLVFLTLIISVGVSFGAPEQERAIRRVAIVPYGAGGSTDATARIIASKLSDIGMDIEIVNRPGGGGVDGTYWVSQQPADGSTLIVATPMNFQFIPAAESVGYEWRDFEPVATWSSAAFAFVSLADAPWESLNELLEYARNSPGRVNVGSTGVRGEYEYYVTKLGQEAGVDFNYVGFDGGGDVTTALLGGHIDVGYISVAGTAQLVASGDLKPLAHTSPTIERLAIWPDVPSTLELGYDVFHVSYYSFWAPKGTPLDVRQSLANAVREASQDADVIQQNADRGLIVDFLGLNETYEMAERVEAEVLPGFLEMIH